MKSTITIIDKQGIIRFQKFGIFIFLLFFSTLTLSHSQQELLQYYNNKPASYQPRTKYIENNKAIFVNHLIASNSPYLLQHAHNPVDWYQFNDEAFNLAKSQRKLIFLSIGYATCHWCHVMEDESFEDLAVAKVLNDNFISIKVDREVLPDVDSHFMNISALINGNGGWPLNVVLTPNGDGFFAGTYFPKDDLITHLQDIQKVWNSDKQKILTIAKTISNALIRKNDTAKKLPLTLQKTAIDELLIKFDEFYGGFSEAPKFPKESQLLMLLDAQQRSPNKHIREAIITTLDNMASGGMYDIVAGGFHRYATDNEWIFPHFEKMLYNQAQLAMVYIKAHQVTRKDSYKRIAIQTLDYVLREMQHKNGGFYSATDADSSGAEGVFFTWSTAEIKQVLDDDFMLFSKYFDLSRATKFEERHVIHYKDFAKLSATDFRKIQPLLDKLYSVRQQREKPLLDNKILLSWNALLLKAFVVASEIDNKYLLYAQNLAQFLTTHFYNNTLKRVKIDNQVAQNGIFEDYIYFADGLLALFDATENVKYLQLSQQLVDEAIDKFWDTKYFGFRVSNNKYINNNNKEIYDGAIVSSNGIAYAVLQKLSDRTQLDKYKKLAKQLVQSFSTTIVQQPSSYPTIITSYIAKKRGVLTKKVYVYDGKIRIERRADKVLIHMQKGWHINAHDISTQGIIPTTLNGNIKNIIYPKGEMIDLGFSNEKLAVYTNTIEISFDDNTAQQLTLTIQACSDKICLPPQTIILGATLF